ncbi:MAG: UDP-3-O-(3-hydroxymyristoyl)glucosamine N-acyltransferase [Candidatus Cloacimonadota bacterium]|nr:MAG: UDP-3-O-(3-hydroxymyristoyl)glucosamine N-acyltransferase [Candidatus Cloacimonadota bacterium]
MKKVLFKEIKNTIQGEWSGSLEGSVNSVAEIEQAQESDLVYATNENYVAKINESSCGFAIIPFGKWDLNCPYIMVKNPYFSFAKILELFQEKASSQIGVSSLANIHPSVKMGKNVSIYPGVFIGESVSIGDNTIIMANTSVAKSSTIGKDCLVYSNVSIRENTEIKNRVIIQCNAVIASDGYGFVFHEGEHYKIPQIGKVILEDDVEIGANACVDRATFGVTRIGAGTKIDNLVQIGHNVEMGRGCLMASQSGISGSTKVGNFVTFGGQSGSVGHINIGSKSIIYARGVATQEIKESSKISGFPGRSHREELRALASARKIPSLIKNVKKMMKHLDLD